VDVEWRPVERTCLPRVRRRVEVAACEEMEGPSPADLEAIRQATFTVTQVRERERVTEHDVAAFVDVLARSAGAAGRWIHFGMTSSDVVDTGLALQLRAASDVVLDDLEGEWAVKMTRRCLTRFLHSF